MAADTGGLVVSVKTDLDVMTLQFEASHRFNPRPGASFVCTCIFSLGVCVGSLRVSLFIPQSKNTHMGRIENSKLTVGVSVSANGCLSMSFYVALR